MKVADKITDKINRIDTGVVFGYDTLGLTSDEVVAGAKALSRLVSKGLIKRAKKGCFYKPKVSAFGEQKPREDVLLSLYLFKNNNQVAYVTGLRLYNKLGLTTQIPSSIRVASLEKQVKGKVGNVQIKPAKSYVKVTSALVKYLELLDVIKDLNTIPDLQKSDGLVYVKNAISNFDNAEIKKLISCGIAYPPKVRALLGALLESMNIDTVNLSLLKKSINPSSSYSYGITPKMLATVNSWNIV